MLSPCFAWLFTTPSLFLSPLGMWSFSVSELAVPGVEIGRLSATDADLGENARMDFTIVDGEAGDTFNITGLNQEAVILLNKVGVVKQKYLQ